MTNNRVIGLILVYAVAAGAAGTLQGNYYADADRDLFLLPKSAAMSGADMCLFRSTGPLGNPANLANDSVHEAALSYAGYFQNSYSVSTLSYGGPVDRKSGIGVSLGYLLVPDIPMIEGTVLPSVIPTRSASNLFFRFGYGRRIFSLSRGVELHAGAALNLMRTDLVGWTGYGIGADGGITMLFRRIGGYAGLLLQNMTSSYIRWSASYQEYAYPHLLVGLGWQQDFPYIYGRLCAAFLSQDLFSNEGINATVKDSMNSGSRENELSFTSPRMKRIYKDPLMLFAGRYGIEYLILNRLAFRVGYSFATESASFGAGLFLIQNRAGIDFAYLTHDLAPTYKVSINFRWQ